MKINYVDLFSGIGGFALGLKQAGFEFERHYFSEVDTNAIKVYKHHFPKAIGIGDVRTIIPDAIPDKIHIVTFGFPCQDLSISGKGAGLAGAKSGLFFEAIRIIKELRPRVFIFENVKGLLTHDGGRTFKTCLKEIANVGIYECGWQLLNSSWVLPQNRERVYFVGYCGAGGAVGKIFPLEGIGRAVDGIPKRADIASTLTTRYGTSQGSGTYVFESRETGIVTNEARLRRFTRRECERLQGFPDDWTLVAGISRTEAYKTLGNAVTVPIVKLVAERILKFLETESEKEKDVLI